jgi:hypothetical protein
MASDDESESIFDNLFGKDERTDEERKRDKRKWNEESNERSRIAFEKERDRRAEYFAMDQRVRNIVSGEINKLILMGLVVAGVYGLGKEYGWPAGVAVVIVAGAIWWWEDRKAQKLPKYKIEEIDELAEDTVTQERIVACERDGKPWLWAEGEYLHWEGVFDHPYWEDMNKRVRSYTGKPHKDRKADNEAARDASLPYRKAMLARLREQGKDWELPYWARLNSEERK